MNERTWHKGPPPHIGWWNASKLQRDNVWRWWNGSRWSYECFASQTPEKLAENIAWHATESMGHYIWWSGYYPKGARVPRVDPSLPVNKSIVYCINSTLTSSNPDFWSERAWKYAGGREYAAAAGSTPTVQRMKAHMRPLPAAVKEDWNKFAQMADKLPTFAEVANTAYVPGSNQRLSHAVRAADVDFQGAMKRNTDPEARRRDCRAGDTDIWGATGRSYDRAKAERTAGSRSNGQARAATISTPCGVIEEKFAGASSIDLMRELYRRLG